MAQVKCFKCKELGNKKALVKYNAHYYHPDCYAAVLSKKNFDKCVCEIFHLISPGPRINTEREKLLKKGYDDIGMTRALKYIYNVKKYPVPEDKFDDNVGLGLVPIFYREAEDYFDRQEKQQQRIAMTMADSLEKEKKMQEVIVINRNNMQQTNRLLTICEPEEEN